jgi:hypothetical protein
MIREVGDGRIVFLLAFLAACAGGVELPTGPQVPFGHDPIVLVIDSTANPMTFAWQMPTGASGTDTLRPLTDRCVKLAAADSVWIYIVATATYGSVVDSSTIGPAWLHPPQDTVPPFWTVTARPNTSGSPQLRLYPVAFPPC